MAKLKLGWEMAAVGAAGLMDGWVDNGWMMDEVRLLVRCSDRWLGPFVFVSRGHCSSSSLSVQPDIIIL